MWTAFAGLALAGPLAEGERLHYEASWMGIPAGVATAETQRDGQAWVVRVASRSADWLAGLYPVDDRLTSVWAPGTGSQRYETVFREGRFQQDQVMVFDVTAITVSRHQLFDEGWRRWEDRYAAAPGVEDPVSALWRIREAGAGRFDVFSGKRVVPVDVQRAGTETVDGQSTERFDVRTVHDGDLKDRMSLWVTTGEARVPLRAVVATRAGPVTVTLLEREVP
ncbi:MAG: DUF3108 domain-containing protein [Deltaproteobacteria bacterium]|nr:DUF3108 domain-containing protein [Deltaproteobacteria bacterium]